MYQRISCNALPILQAVCDAMKKALRTLMDEFSPLAPSVTELVIQMYDAVPQQSLLDLAKQVVKSYDMH